MHQKTPIGVEVGGYIPKPENSTPPLRKEYRGLLFIAAIATFGPSEKRWPGIL